MNPSPSPTPRLLNAHHAILPTRLIPLDTSLHLTLDRHLFHINRCTQEKIPYIANLNSMMSSVWKLTGSPQGGEIRLDISVEGDISVQAYSTGSSEGITFRDTTMQNELRRWLGPGSEQRGIYKPDTMAVLTITNIHSGLILRTLSLIGEGKVDLVLRGKPTPSSGGTETFVTSSNDEGKQVGRPFGIGRRRRRRRREHHRDITTVDSIYDIPLPTAISTEDSGQWSPDRRPLVPQTPLHISSVRRIASSNFSNGVSEKVSAWNDRIHRSAPPALAAYPRAATVGFESASLPNVDHDLRTFGLHDRPRVDAYLDDLEFDERSSVGTEIDVFDSISDVPSLASETSSEGSPDHLEIGVVLRALKDWASGSSWSRRRRWMC